MDQQFGTTKRAWPCSSGDCLYPGALLWTYKPNTIVVTEISTARIALASITPIMPHTATEHGSDS